MNLVNNHLATTAACYGCLAALKLAGGDVVEALAYTVAAVVHGAAARKDGTGDAP